jgi:hypothetical protein
MKLDDLIEIADRAAMDGCIGQCWDKKGQRAFNGAGDTLAEFVVREIADTYDSGANDQEQLDEAARVIRRAAVDLELVAEELEHFDPEFKR